MKAREKIAALRALMRKHRLNAYLVPSTDPHQSEYVPLCWRRRAYLSGFGGSAGELLVTAKDAGLWTDGRYFLEAEMVLKGSGIRLQKMGQPGVPTLKEYAAANLKKGQVLGVDPQLVAMAAARDLEAAVTPSGAQVRYLEQNLVDEVWFDRPPLPADPIRIHPVKYAGETVKSKLRRLRKEMAEKGASAHFMAALDVVAWLYNIRGSDTMYNPVAIAYALVTPKEARLFIGRSKVGEAAARALAPEVTVEPYAALPEHLRRLASKRARVWCDEATTSRWVEECLSGCDLIRDPSPVVRMKARKNEVEIQGMRRAHDRDGVAMARFLHWLENEVGRSKVTESSAAERLTELRSQEELYQGDSFETISGYGEHGAIIHYRVTPESDARLREKGLYLLDSGGQYSDGTIDCTRTVLLGRSATREQKEQFTRVLKGHIALARSRFPAGTRGIQLDTLARVALWEAGLDYNHGTGHGVGAHLCVHEGPQSIAHSRDTKAPLEPGNILSNEPGYYIDGSYGIRIENLILVTEDEKLSRGGRKFLRFETLTKVPIDLRLVEPKLLTGEEREWLNEYHREVMKTVSPRLEAKERKWLKRACAEV